MVKIKEHFKVISIDEIFADDDFNCRGRITANTVIELANSIQSEGLLQPIVVMPYEFEQYKYKLLAGFRRRLAHIVLKLKRIKAIIRPPMDQESALLLNLSENLNRKDLNILQEAKALKKLKDGGLSREDTAEKLGTSPGWVQVRYMLLDLPKALQEMASGKIITQKNIRELYTIMQSGNTEALIEAAKALKNAKERGRKISVCPKRKSNRNTKVVRKRFEIFEMMDHMIGQDLPGLHTRAMAWCAGEITTGELLDDCVIHAKARNKTFLMPNLF